MNHITKYCGKIYLSGLIFSPIIGMYDNLHKYYSPTSSNMLYLMLDGAFKGLIVGITWPWFFPINILGVYYEREFDMVREIPKITNVNF
jgi:hypothetical protein